MELETDENGIVTFLPLTAWLASVVMGQTVGLAIDYYASADDAAAARTSRIQIHIDPTVAKQIGQSLIVRGDMVLAGDGAAPGA
jgi:hypothetical protein